MSVSIRLALPTNANLEKIAALAGVLAGLPTRTFGDGNSYQQVIGATWETVPITGMFPLLQLHLTGPQGATLIEGSRTRYCSYRGVSTHRIYGLPAGYHIFSMPSNGFWAAISVGLVDFFGGHLDINDCDNSAIDYSSRTRRAQLDEDPEYTNYSNALYGTTPITRSDIEMYNEIAYYQTELPELTNNKLSLAAC